MDIKEAEVLSLAVADLQPNDGQLESIGVHSNPRSISESEYAALVESMRKDDLTGVMPLKVYKHDGRYVVLGGNMRLRALRELGVQSVRCIEIPQGTNAQTLNKIIITDNSTFGEWNLDELANWNEPLAEWGVELPTIEDNTTETRKKHKPLEVRITFESEELLQAFVEKYNDVLKSEYDCDIITA